MTPIYISSPDNVDKQVTLLAKVIISSIYLLPRYTTRTASQPPVPWINDDIKRAIDNRNNAHKALKSNRN